MFVILKILKTSIKSDFKTVQIFDILDMKVPEIRLFMVKVEFGVAVPRNQLASTEFRYWRGTTAILLEFETSLSILGAECQVRGVRGCLCRERVSKRQSRTDAVSPSLWGAEKNATYARLGENPAHDRTGGFRKSGNPSG